MILSVFRETNEYAVPNLDLLGTTRFCCRPACGPSIDSRLAGPPPRKTWGCHTVDRGRQTISSLGRRAVQQLGHKPGAHERSLAAIDLDASEYRPCGHFLGHAGALGRQIRLRAGGRPDS